MIVAISDACGGYFGRQGGEVRLYYIPEDEYDRILEETDDPTERANLLKENGDLEHTIQPDDTLPV